MRYPQGGFGALIARIAAIAEAAGVEVITNATVEAIELTDDAMPSVAGVRYRDPSGAPHRVPAHRVVSAADLHHTETELLPARAQTYPEPWWDRRTSGPGAVLAMLGVRGRMPGLLHHTLFFTEDWHDNFERIFGDDPRIPDPASFYVCTPSATDPTVAPPGDTNLFVLVPVPADVSIGRGGEDGTGDRLVEQAVDRAIARIAAATGLRPTSSAGSSCVAPSGRPTSPRTCTRGAAARSARRTPSGRARSCAARTVRDACTACSTRAVRACRASACRCA